MIFTDEFEGKIVIITGASGGIGKETAVHYARAGAHVVIGDVKTELGEKAAQEITESNEGDACFMYLDVTDPTCLTIFFDEVKQKFGRIDILVNSAGVSGEGFKPFHQTQMGDWDLTYEINVKGLVNCCQAVFETFKKQKHGKIVNVSSLSGKQPTPGLMPYAASKAAVINLSQTMAVEMARFNVNVNVVCPGWIWTPIYDESVGMKKLAEKTGQTPREFFMNMVNQYCCLKREQTETDIAQAVLFLSSEAAKNITGQSLNIDGGALMS